MKYSLSTILLLLFLAGACKKDDDTSNYESLNYLMVDSTYYFMGYYVDSNNQYHSVSTGTLYPIHRFETLIRSQGLAKNFVLYRSDTFWQNKDTMTYTCIGTKNPSFLIATLGLNKDSIWVSGLIQKSMTFQYSCGLRGLKQ
ncbi:MAG: hypothetical protein JST27_00065 [Bacteroidetes bacterium]|nr:hypothetical protein [Bacteroidota bacterium]